MRRIGSDKSLIVRGANFSCCHWLSWCNPKNKCLQKQAINRIIAFVPIRITDIGQEFAKSIHVFLWYLQSHQYAAIIGTVIAIMEKADIPVGSHRGQETHQGSRSFREFETVEQFVFRERTLAAYHIADMKLAELIIAQIDGFVIVLLKRVDDVFLFLAVLDFDTDKNVSRFFITDAVVEFGDVSGSDQFAETFETAAFLRNRDG